MDHSIWDKLLPIVGTIAGYAIEKLNQLIKDKRKSNKNKLKANAVGLSNNMEIDRQVKHVEIKFATFGPNRVFVMHFHNGTLTDAGLSIQKVVISHEIVIGDYPKMTPYHQSIPIPEFLQRTLSRVVFQDWHEITDRENIHDKNPELYNWMVHYGVISQYCSALYDTKTKMIVAVLVIQFDRIHKMDEAAITKINEEKKRIEAIFGKLPNPNNTELT